MKLSCGDHSFPVLPHEQTVELVKMLGFDGFDLAVMGNRSHVRPEVIREDIPAWAGRLEERYIAACDEQLAWDQLPDDEPFTHLKPLR